MRRQAVHHDRCEQQHCCWGRGWRRVGSRPLGQRADRCPSPVTAAAGRAGGAAGAEEQTPGVEPRGALLVPQLPGAGQDGVGQELPGVRVASTKQISNSLPKRPELRPLLLGLDWCMARHWVLL